MRNRRPQPGLPTENAALRFPRIDARSPVTICTGVSETKVPETLRCATFFRLRAVANSSDDPSVLSANSSAKLLGANVSLGGLLNLISINVATHVEINLIELFRLRSLC